MFLQSCFSVSSGFGIMIPGGKGSGFVYFWSIHCRGHNIVGSKIILSYLFYIVWFMVLFFCFPWLWHYDPRWQRQWICYFWSIHCRGHNIVGSKIILSYLFYIGLVYGSVFLRSLATSFMSCGYVSSVLFFFFSYH